jgi:PhzF family phenazine biosynthesis protein
VLDETGQADEERCALPARLRTSHAVFVADHGTTVELRFFTATGELPACGHGTVAALARLAARHRADDYRTTLRAGGRTFAGRATRVADGYTATFDPGPVMVRTPGAGEPEALLDALGVPRDAAAGCRVASVGRPRLLVPVPDAAVLAGLRPDPRRLRAACDERALLGCYVYSVPVGGRCAARMFAPSIGVPEDIANANSTACLAGYLAGTGLTRLTVDMGDSLGQPATIVATAEPAPGGTRVVVGGDAGLGRWRQGSIGIV